MSKGELTYDELKAGYVSLQKQAARSLLIKEELIQARDKLDRNLGRFRSIQEYSEKAIKAATFEDFAEITVESIIETFEVECSGLLVFDKAKNGLEANAAFGFENVKFDDPLEPDWLKGKGLHKGENAFIEKMDADNHPWGRLGLCQAILCPYDDSRGDLKGFLLGGRSEKNAAYYDEITQEMIPSFMVFTQQMSMLLQNLRSRENLERTVQERTEELKDANAQLENFNKALHQEIAVRARTEEKLRMAEREATELSEFLKKMFGRYLSSEVMNSLLKNPSALELGGQRRRVTIMMSDLRGFTALSERLEPEKVVQMLNIYFETMVGVIHRYHGTVNEIIGDSLLVIFGAPEEIPERAQRAVACAISMQNAMADVNQRNRKAGLPELEMGVGLHDTEVIVGNIGSSKRLKYSVVGSGVNLASRIESYTVGGQVLISESVRKEAGECLRIDGRKRVLPKGAESSVAVYDVGGIGGPYNLALEEKEPVRVSLGRQIPIKYMPIGGKHIGMESGVGRIVRLSKKSCEIECNQELSPLANIKMNLREVDEELGSRDFYGKVIEPSPQHKYLYVIRFTAVPPEISAYFQSHRQHAVDPEKG